MSAFLEERLSVAVRLGARYGDGYDVEITTTAGGAEYRRLIHGLPRRTFDVSYLLTSQDLWNSVLALYHRAFGRFAGFRVRCSDDYSTNGQTGTPTALDQVLSLVSTGVYQLRKEYGAGGTPLDIGRPYRPIYKPVAGTVKVGVGGVEIPSTAGNWSVDTTTGKVTFAANKTATITGITKASQAVLSVGAHSFVVGEYVYVSGVSGMTQINGKRAAVTAFSGTTITVNINSTAYSTYSSGGAVNTRPQSGEAVTGGCEFDIPCRFDTDIDVAQNYPTYREASSIQIVEVLNP